MAEDKAKDKKQVTIPVKGMTCASCVSRVERALKKVPGVSEATVNLASERASVLHDRRASSIEDLFKAVEGAGYEPRRESLTVGVEGMTCASCVRRVETALKKVPGVLSATVNLFRERATVEFLPGQVAIADLRRAVDDAGYRLRELAEEAPDVEAEARGKEQRTLLA